MLENVCLRLRCTIPSCQTLSIHNSIRRAERRFPVGDAGVQNSQFSTEIKLRSKKPIPCRQNPPQPAPRPDRSSRSRQRRRYSTRCWTAHRRTRVHPGRHRGCGGDATDAPGIHSNEVIRIGKAQVGYLCAYLLHHSLRTGRSSVVRLDDRTGYGD